MPEQLSNHFSLADMQMWQWALAVAAAFCVGLSKGGLAGVGMAVVVLMAQVMDAKASTGAVLPLLIMGDVFAVRAYGEHAHWGHIRNLLLPSMLGVCLGCWLMSHMSKAIFSPLLGALVLSLVIFQLWRNAQGKWLDEFFQKKRFAYIMGWLGGVTTMLANAAGPVMSLFMLAVRLPKMELIGTMAWFFCILNIFKVPFSAGMGLIHTGSLSLGLVLAPVVVAGVYAGKWIVVRIPQRIFDPLLLIFTAIAAVHLIWSSLPKTGV